MSQTPNLDAARASLQQAIDQANAIVKPIIDAIREYEGEPSAVANVVSNLVETFNDAHRARGGQEEVSGER